MYECWQPKVEDVCVQRINVMNVCLNITAFQNLVVEISFRKCHFVRTPHPLNWQTVNLMKICGNKRVNAVKLSLIFFFRYLELVYPIWHKVYFKMRYLYTAIALCWTLGIGLEAAYVIPISKVFVLSYHIFVDEMF